MADRPNILVLFTDMQRADTIAALGNPVIKTPHLDRLVREGCAFTSAYSPSPVCVTARCSLHYGLYPERTGCTNNEPMMDDNNASLPAILGRHGYHTASIGTCHFTPDRLAKRGFHERLIQEVNFPPGPGKQPNPHNATDPSGDDYYNWLEANGFSIEAPYGEFGEMYYLPQPSTLPAAAHCSTWTGDRCVEHIAKRSHISQPWL